MTAQSTQRIVYFDLDVKFWAGRPPSVGGARPACCPRCGAPGAAPGDPIGLVGHGLRERTVLGPWGFGAPPEEVTFRARRYRCTRCRAVLCVVPRGILGISLIVITRHAMAITGFSGWRSRSGGSGAGWTWVQGSDLDLRREGPDSLSLWARCRTRSQMASARVGSSMYSCHFSGGSWPAITTELAS